MEIERSEVLTAMTVKITVSRHVAPCDFIHIYGNIERHIPEEGRLLEKKGRSSEIGFGSLLVLRLPLTIFPLFTHYDLRHQFHYH
jgi:hypothetical protein